MASIPMNPPMALPIPETVPGSARVVGRPASDASGRQDVVTSGEPLPLAGEQSAAERQPPADELRRQAEALAERAREQATSMRRKLEFNIDEESHEVTIKVRDAETGRLIRKIPPQEVLDLAERLSETVGVLFRSVV